MIDELRIRNVALIDDATMRFAPGLTVLTGETGAGKTALLNGLKLAMGARADATAVRDGAGEAIVEALFSVDDDAMQAMQQRGFECDEPRVLVKRSLSSDGRSKCYVNDGMVTVKGLSDTVGALVDLLSQHQNQELLSVQNHVRYLDAWAGDLVAGPRETYGHALDAWHRSQRELEQLRQQLDVSDYQLEQARYLCEQIGAVNPGATEHDELEARLPIVRNGERLASAASDALHALRGDGQVIDTLSSALQELQRAGGVDQALDALAQRLESLQLDAEDLAAELRDYRDGVEFDPIALQETLDRLGELDGLVRRFGPTYEAMLERWQSAQELLQTAQGGTQQLQRLQKRVDDDEAALRAAARQLEDARTAAAKRFCAELQEQVTELAMANTVFAVHEDVLDMAQWTRTGSRRYEILYAPARDVRPRPLSKIASGGELSRVMLALECMIGAQGRRKTLVFDEIDAGIGGITATAVAKRVRQLAQYHQVIVVTHLSQIAVEADVHLLVRKVSSQTGASTVIEQLQGDERVEEVARMLSGSTDQAALQHARTMLGERA